MMSDQELLAKLHQFSDYLQIGNLLNYCLRWIGWYFIKGLAWLVDGLENVTDSILGLKTFFDSEKVQDFVSMIEPFLYVLLAFSILYIGYMLIMNKKFNREQVAINIFIAIAVLVLINTGMAKADKFTDQSIDAINVNGSGTASEKIIKDGMTDVARFDQTGWKTTDLKTPNKVPLDSIKNIDITEKITKDFEIKNGQDLTNRGKDILSHKIVIAGNGKDGVDELAGGWFKIDEHYYRWSWDFWTIAITLFVTGMTMLFICIKLAKLCYELAFNYILVHLIAPSDVANGQRLKQVLMNLLNTFLIIIMIFLSLKVYLMGTVFISDKLDGFSYLIAMIAFSMAVVDGPMLCERLFGIDAGLKSGWGAVAGGFALGRATSRTLKGFGKGAGQMAKGGFGGALAAGGAAAGTAAGLKGAGKGKGEGNAQTSLKDEMKADDASSGLQGKGRAGQNSQPGGHREAAATLQDEMTSGGSSSGTSDTTPDTNPTTGTSGAGGGSAASGATLQDEMKESDNASSSAPSGSHQGTGSDMPGDTSKTSSVPSSTTLDDEMNHSGSSSSVQGSETPSSNEPTGNRLQDEMRAAGYTSGKEDTNTKEDHSKETENIPMPNQHRTETRTIGQYAKDRVREKAGKSKTIQRTKRMYQLGKNTGESLRNRKKK